MRDAGLVAETSYVSPQFGFAVEWDDSWVLNENFAPPVVSDQQGGADELNLKGADTYLTYLKVYGYSSKGYGVAELERQLAYMRSEDFLNLVFVDDYTVILEESNETSGGIVVLWETEGWEYLWVFETYLAQDGEALIRVAFTTTPDQYRAAYEKTSETVRLNGVSPFASVFDMDDVLSAVARHHYATTPTPEPGRTPTPGPTASPRPTSATTPTADSGYGSSNHSSSPPTKTPGEGY